MIIAIQIIMIAWIIQFAAGMIISAPFAFLFRKRSFWSGKSLLAFIYPFGTWLI
jgi:hypothetical protein